MDRVEIRLLREQPGMGGIGDVVAVGQERADRWCREGLAVMVEAGEKKKTKTKTKKNNEEEGA